MDHPSERPSVLIVEDYEDTACLAQFVLEREGYAVTRLPDGRTAHHRITSSAPPHVVLLDIGLPDMAGLDLLRIIRTTPEWQWTPVLLLTSDSRSETMIAAAHLGATHYVCKPFTAARLLAAVRPFMADRVQPADGRTEQGQLATPHTPLFARKSRGLRLDLLKGETL